VLKLLAVAPHVLVTDFKYEAYYCRQLGGKTKQ